MGHNRKMNQSHRNQKGLSSKYEIKFLKSKLKKGKNSHIIHFKYENKQHDVRYCLWAGVVIV